MARNKQNATGCGEFSQLLEKGYVKNIKSLQKGADDSIAFFIEVLSSLKQSPCEILQTHPATTCFLIARGVIDQDDGKVWDWYAVHCPMGPPCDFMENL